MNVGERMTYKYNPRGGYDYRFRTPVTVVGFTATGLVRVRITRHNGTTVVRTVSRESLEPLKQPSPEPGA